MQRYDLISHSEFLPLAVRGVVVEVVREAEALSLSYRVLGAEAVKVPEPAVPARTDELWRTTCFELFLMFDHEERYVEFNFSPSTQWAAYAFDGHREGMADLARAVPPSIERRPDGIAVTCDLGGLPRGELAMALTAVIEEGSGVKSYWSLAHPAGPPDFHAAACFVARLPAPEVQ